MKVKKIYEGVYLIDGKLATLNLAPGFKVYGEKLIKIKGKEYRIWNPFRSKLGAAIKKGMDPKLKKDYEVLYLGAASGTTASHVSDICRDGMVYCVEISPRVFRDLVKVCERRMNMIPILADANKCDYPFVGKVDYVYQDIAQPNQIEILIKNCEAYAPKYAMLALKARSIDVTRKPVEIFKEAERELKERFELIDKRRLEPFHKDHMMFLLRWA